jgi:50S ribosomal protein L4
MDLHVIQPELKEEIFGVRTRPHLLHQTVVMQLNNRRAGTASTKSKGFVRGGGKKPWRQKGTGRARAGSTRSPLWVGGGNDFWATTAGLFLSDASQGTQSGFAFRA